ncbi:MAG: DNA mismatch repair endonuclease MutL [Planctomycetota bacterium]|nr:DNA mismatch repair endonuclease MutL [Planctomycetota bacterium]
MGRIHVLDPHVINQIAAGEVVERPASVVKELVENALDAGATRIEVTVREGGRDLIEVQDDGHGMPPEDLETVFLPHATSKISDVEDLRHIASMGFRGEALASIGSVARASIVSRQHDAEEAWRVENLEGVIGAVAPAGGSPGTIVRVEQLFARVPARRKFLRTPGTELGHIKALIGRCALAFPHVGFRLRQGTQVLLEAPPEQDRRLRIAQVHGDDVARALVHARATEGEPTLEAWIGPPSFTRRDAKLEQVFLNGRHIRDRTVAHAIREAYRDLLPPGGRRPVAFVFLGMDPGRVDVNVHPGKTEVRWRDPSAVHRAVRRTLRAALEDVAPGLSVPLPGGPVEHGHDHAHDHGAARSAAVEQAFLTGAGRPAVAERGFAFRPSVASPAALAQGAPAATEPGARTAAEAEGPRTSIGGLRPVGQLLGTYLVLEGQGELVLIDQHALHERVLFDRINARLRQEGNLEVQRMLVPAVVHLEPADLARLLEARDVLQTLGWILEPFGEDAVAVNGIPAVLRRPDPEGALEEMIELLERGQRDGVDRTHLVSEAVDRMACRAAVMAGDALHTDEVMALLEQAEALNHSHSCPHGRPTRLTMTRGQLERWFHRTV